MDAFIRHCVLQVLLAIPGVCEFTFVDGYEQETRELKALAAYMTAQLMTLGTQCVTPSQREAMVIVKEPFSRVSYPGYENDDSDTDSDG
jgi:hypothetical protein